jgi:hypothetical protein
VPRMRRTAIPKKAGDTDATPIPVAGVRCA